MPPLQGIGGLWHNTSADIVHDASCEPIMPSPRGEIGREMRNPTLYTSKTPTRQHRGVVAAARRRRGTLAAGKRVHGLSVARAATAVLGANIPRARRRACP
jgi:hypothetical protein